MRHKDAENDPWAAPDPALAFALQQVEWYRVRRDRARQVYWAVQIVLLVATAATTVSAALGAKPLLSACLAAVSVIAAGVGTLSDSHERWVSCGLAWVDLRTAVHEYRLLAEADRDADTRRRLVERVDEIVGAETKGWASRRRRTESERS